MKVLNFDLTPEQYSKVNQHAQAIGEKEWNKLSEKEKEEEIEIILLGEEIKRLKEDKTK